MMKLMWSRRKTYFSCALEQEGSNIHGGRWLLREDDELALHVYMDDFSQGKKRTLNRKVAEWVGSQS